MLAYLAASETLCIIYRPDLYNIQANRKNVKKYLIVETGISINVKTKNILKSDPC